MEEEKEYLPIDLTRNKNFRIIEEAIDPLLTPEVRAGFVMGNVRRGGNVPVVHGFVNDVHEGAGLGFAGAGGEDES